MADYKETQKQYMQSKLVFRQASAADYLARQEYHLWETKVEEFLKAASLASLPAGHVLLGQEVEIKKKVTNLSAALNSAKQALQVSREAFNALGTVNLTVGNIDDSRPILLMPLKIQTRFRTIKHITRNLNANVLVDVNNLLPNAQQQLRRVFLQDLRPPGEPLRMKAFPAFILSNSRQVGINRVIHELNQIDPRVRVPVERLVRVEDEFELWVRIFPDDLFLQSHEPALTESEMEAAKVFWQSMWNAERAARTGGNEATKREQQLSAWRDLRSVALPHRASWIARIMKPAEFPDQLPNNLVTIPDNKFPNPGLKSDSWTMPPSTDMLPEHFVVKLFFEDVNLPPREVIGGPVPDYVQMGFDPDEQDEQAFTEQGRVLQLPAALRWLTDLKEAEKMGLAIRVPLSRQESTSGISKLVVVGLKSGADALQGSQNLSSLFINHQYKSEGMALLPHGTSTNNLPGQASGFRPGGLSDESSFDVEFKKKTDDVNTDGKRLALALGLNADLFRTTPNSDGFEGQEALMLNRALWPATLGYYLENHMRPNVTDEDRAHVKSFFQNFVTGRGLLPSFRIGKQPYGIVPATNWSSWKAGATASQSENRLVRLLSKLDGQWERLSAQVKTIKKVFAYTDPQLLKNDFREIMAMQASSTRFFRRLVAGEYLLWNINAFSMPLNTDKVGIRTTPSAYKTRLESADAWQEPLAQIPRMLGRFFDDDNYKLTDLPTDIAKDPKQFNERGRNYLSFLLDRTVDQLRNRDLAPGFSDFVTRRSSTLVFETARFALLQAWIEAATAVLRKEDASISPLAKLDFETEYINAGNDLSTEHLALLAASNINGGFTTRKSKWTFLEQVLPDQTRVDARIQQLLATNLPNDSPVKNLQDTIKAITSLTTLPPERLERIFSEHVDLCSFRLDSWMQGLVLERLFNNRKKPGFETGLTVGAFGYLESVKPGTNPWVEVKEITAPQIERVQESLPNRYVLPLVDLSGFTADQLPAVRKQIFAYLGSDPDTKLAVDSRTGIIVVVPSNAPISEAGFMLTPSLEHAATAAILRAGYEHYAGSQGADSKSLAVNLSVQRTDKAMRLLKGMKSGHSLNEQLGYFIERSMYEVPDLPQFIPALRKAFPLQIELNEWDDDQHIGEQQKVHNLSLVLDGLAITKASQPATQKFTDTVASFGNTTAANSFIKIINECAEQFDAVSDLVLAETFYQTVKGSPERAAAALRMVGEGSDISLPEVVDVPGDSRLLSFRFGLVLNTPNNTVAGWGAGGTPSVFTELSPVLNRWLADHLPSPDRIIIRVNFSDEVVISVNVASLGIQPIDFYYLLSKTAGRAQDTLLTWWSIEVAGKHPDAAGKVPVGASFERDAAFKAGEFSIRELLPLINSISALLERSRPMRPGDFILNTDNKTENTATLYNNNALKIACTKYADNTASGPLAVLGKKLSDAKQALELNIPADPPSAVSEQSFSQLIRAIPQAYFCGLWDALPRCPNICNKVNALILIDQTNQLINQIKNRSTQSSAALAGLNANTTLNGEQLFDELTALARRFAGESFITLPVFALPEKNAISGTYNDASLTASIGEFGMEEWIQGLSMVRENVRKYQTLSNLRSVYPTPSASRKLQALQLPFKAGTSSHWIGVPFPQNFEPSSQVLSMVYEFSGPLNLNESISGLLLDDWREKVPLENVQAGISIKYNQSNAEAPQCMLLMVAPEIKGAWDWPSIVDGVLSTMTLAKKRAVDGELIQSTWLSQFLPAIVTPIDSKNNIPTLDFRMAGPMIKPVVTDVGGTGGGVLHGGVFHGGVITGGFTRINN
ncbi:hypothetical protein WBG78_19225 [Chryseolinea sp. T2]|uniref:hypothetical protein n=1 Tax=Chryseolinea sp. T2 TaxID=3129255 RepID=UPI0030782E62